MVYVNYKTKLTSPVKESVNPTNEVKLTAGDVTAKSTIEVSLVGGKGNAVGENKPKPTWELPNDAPVVELPELNLNDVPQMPPAPILEVPELDITGIPMMPPPPILEVPELDITGIPMMPPPPVVEIPEYKLPKVEETPKVVETPKTVEVKQTVYGATPQLPNTGESSTTLLTFVGTVVLGTSMYLMRKAKEEN